MKIISEKTLFTEKRKYNINKNGSEKNTEPFLFLTEENFDDCNPPNTEADIPFRKGNFGGMDMIGII